MKISGVALFVFVLQLPFLKGFCWGAEGHRITASIAFQELPQSIRDSLTYYLGSKTIQEASTWMDEVRSDHNYDELKPLHYINIDKGQSYKPTEGNIISELQSVIAELKNRKGLSKATVALDLKILIHLLGDLHQPLHVGYGSDRGGNSINVDYLETESNLHKVWDSEIIRTKAITTDSCIQRIHTYSQSVQDKMCSGDVVSWMLESRELLNTVYAFKDGKLDQAYVSMNAEVVEQQLSLSGMRMARILNEIFASA